MHSESSSATEAGTAVHGSKAAVNDEVIPTPGFDEGTDGDPRPSHGALDHSSGSSADVPLSHRWFLTRPVAVYLLCRVVTLASLGIADLFTHNGLGRDLGGWDAQWFIRAALHGWPSHLPMVDGHVAPSTIAFFPSFPLLIRWSTALTGASPIAVGVVMSGVTGLSSVIGVGMLVRQFAGEEKAERATLLFAVFPGTFVFSLVYSEGMVITCVAFGLLALLRRRWWLAGILGLVASATSPVALVFTVSCLWCAAAELRRDRNWRALIAPALAPLGFVAYMLWLWAHTADPWVWRLAERGGWKSYPSLGYPVHIVTTFLFDPVAPTRTGQLLVIGTVVAIIGAVFAVREHQPPPVLLYGLAAAALAAVSAPVGLRPRFLLLAFPLIVAIGTRLRGRTYWGAVVLSTCSLVVMSLTSLASTAVFP